MNTVVKHLCCLLNVAALAVAVAKQPSLPIGECIVMAGTSEATSFSFSCQLAAFGAYLPNEREDANVVLPPDDKMLGCSSFVDESGQNPSRFEGAAVIVRRGECSFQKKLKNVAATGAALMVHVNSENTLIPLSSLEFEHSPAAAVSVTQKDGEKLIQLVNESQLDAAGGLTGVALRITRFLGLVNQARARLQFLVDTNVPVLVYEEYEDVVEQLEPLVGTMDGLLSTILSKDYNSIDIPRGEAKELVEFFSWSAQQLSKWGFANQAALHATVAAAVLQIQLWSRETRDFSHKDHLVLRAAAQKLTEMGYYSHSASLFQPLTTFSNTRTDTLVQCRLSFVKFLQGDLRVTFSEAMRCKISELNAGIPSLQVPHNTFLRLLKLNMSEHDYECLELSGGSINDTNLASTCCSLVERSSNTNEHSESLSRQFSSEFVKELFYALVTMGVFMDELGSFAESHRFFSHAAQLCQGDKTTLKLRQLLAVPVVFSSQNEMDTFMTELKNKLNKFTESVTRKQALEERMVSPVGSAYESNRATLKKTNPVLRPEAAAYLQYTITPPTMFIGYQGIDVLPIQRAINQLRTTVFPSLSSSFEPQNSERSEESLSGDSHKLRRVGFISTWFRVHSVGKLLLGVVQNLDRTKFRVIIYHCVHFLRDADEITEAFKHTADEFVKLPKSQDAAVHLLRKALLDVAVFPELGMDEWTILLSHHRVAPIQCVFWGHPITTGNPHIDYFISSQHFVSEHFNDPNQSSEQLSGYHRSSFSEQIVLFRGLSTIFTEPKPRTAESERITRSRLHLPTNRRIYLCPQTLMKLHPAFDEALAGILEHDDNATIVVLASDTQIVWTEQLRRRFRQRFGRNHRRLLFLPTLPFAEFQALLALADVVLDPFPFGGGVTTLDALHLGIPVVTLPAAQSVVHLAAGFLRYMNASDCIATSLDDYIQLAIRIAVNHEDIQQRLLSHRSDIYQDVSTIEDWNIFLNTVTTQ